MVSLLLIMFWGLVFCLLAATLFQASVNRSNHLRDCFQLGIIFWRGFLPTASAVVFAGLMAVNLFNLNLSPNVNLQLTAYFSVSELAFLLALSPLLCMRFNNSFAFVLLLYTMLRLASTKASLNVTPGMLLLIFTLINLSLLGDFQPWLNSFFVSPTFHKLREVILLCMALAALMSLFFVLANVGNFNRWLGSQYMLKLPLWQTTLGVILLIIGWLSVALGFSRSVSLPILISCTISIFSFIFVVPNFLLIVPFAAGLALSFTKQYPSIQLRA